MRRSGASAGAGTTGLERDDRLRPGNPRCDFEEAARVAEILDVHEDARHGGVVLPLQQEIVAAYIRLVPDRDELRDADAVLRGVVQHAEAERAGLRDKRGPAFGRHGRREGRVHGVRGIGVEHAHAIGPHHPHSVTLHDLHELALSLDSLASDFPKSGGDNDESANAGFTAFFGYSEDVLLRHDDDGEVHLLADSRERRCGADGSDGGGFRIDRENRAGESMADEVGEHLVADGVWSSGGANDRDRSRLQNGVEDGDPDGGSTNR